MLTKYVNLIRLKIQKCPWGQSQSNETLSPLTLEEAEEVVEAVHLGDAEHLADELADLLFHVVAHAEISPDFDIDTVISKAEAKLIRRNPHLFTDKDVTLEEAKDIHASIKSLESNP